ncbi:MAG: hypothetical protein K5985_11190 [Lachnospiraceae bacterium]|nr:hypothetical protein [Lachnospiraceae bacterium]
MFCPQCRREYREGFAECAYCKVPLVETLPEENTEPEEINAESAPETFEEFIEDIIPDEEVLSEAGMSREEFVEALQAEMEKERAPKPKRFRTAEERLSDVKTSGWTLSGVGILGLLAIILCVSGVLPIRLYGIASVLTYGTMGILFLVFVVIGFKSLAKISSLTEECRTEKEKTKEIREYILGSFTGEKIDEAVKDMTDEAGGAYYARIAFIREWMLEKYPELEASYADYLIEDLYQALFEA